MAAHQRPVAQLQSLVKDLPKLVHIPAGGAGNVYQIQGHNALVEPAVIFGLVGLGVYIRGQEAAAAHAGVAVALSVFIHLIFQHFLFADIVRYHALGGALGGQLGQVPVGGALMDIVLLQHIDQLGEGGGDPHALFVLHALDPLAQRLLNDHGQVGLFLGILGLAQVHKHGHKGCLAVGGQQGDHLVLNGLHTTTDFVPQALLGDLVDLFLIGSGAEGLSLFLYRSADLFPTDLHKGRQVGQADGLAAVLGGGYLGYNLGGDVAGGGEAVGLLNHGAADHGTVLQHILQVHQVAVVHMLGKVVAVMEVNNARLVSLYNILGQQNALGDVLRHLAGHIVPLHAVNGGVLVGVFLLDLLVVALNEGEDLVVCGVGLADQGAGVAVAHIAPGHFKGTLCHDLVLHNVLNFLYGQGPIGLYRLEFHILGDLLNL